MGIRILGTGLIKFGERWNEGVEGMAAQAVAEALAEAHLKIADIDLLLVGNMLLGRLEGRSQVGRLVGEALGFGGEAVAVEAACASGGVAVRQAMMAIKAGEAGRVLVVGVEKMTDVDMATITRTLMAAGGEDEQMTGATFAALYALMQQAYQEKYQVREADIDEMAVLAHKHGAENILAQFRRRVTVEEVKQSPLVAEPIRQLHCAPISDGAAAIILASSDLGLEARNRKGIQIIGSGQGGETLSLAKRKTITEIGATQRAMKRALIQAEVDVKEIDVIEVHDCFSVAGLIALEDLGFCGKGEAVQMIKSEDDWWINPSGGLKACGHPVGATGVKQVVEITRQLQGRCGLRQVRGAKIGLTHNVGGTGATVVVHILVKRT